MKEIKDVVNSFNIFLTNYEEWRIEHGLSGKITNVYEILAALTDKLGRVCRQVKHQERNDPKPDWPEGMTTEMAGLLIYLILLKNNYNVDMAEGMCNELQKSVSQHSKK